MEKAALRGGGVRISPITTTWDCASGCLTPYIVTYCCNFRLFDHALKRRMLAQPPYPVGLTLAQTFDWVAIPARSRRYLLVKQSCRRCSTCLKKRQRLWARRAKAEILASERSWFMTFTVSPQYRTIYAARASRRLGCSVDTLSDDEVFAAHYREISLDFTKYLKRIRKASGASLRFIMVVENHANGYPHLHAFIHEREGRVTKALLQEHWRVGFSTAKLCSPETVFYVTKYLSKQARARVRASLQYGTTFGIVRHLDVSFLTPQPNHG